MRALLMVFTLLMVACAAETGDKGVLSQVLWSQSDTSHNNYRIPSLIVTQEGTLLAFAEGREGGDAGDIDLLLRRSTDNGHTWDEAIVVWDDGANTCGNPCPVVDERTGRIVLLMTWNLGTDKEYDIIRKQSDSTRVPYITYSDDDGRTWSSPRSLYDTGKDPQWGWYATGPGVGIQLKSAEYEGRLVIPCNNSYDDPKNVARNGFGYGAHVLLSDDGGDSWRRSTIITPEVNESQVIERSDGTLIMNMRSYHGKDSRAIAESTDGGATWSAVRHDPQLVEPVCQASVIAFGDYADQRMYLFSNPAVSGQRTHMTIKSSFDEGQTWTDAKLVHEGPAAYSSLAPLPNGNIGIFFERGQNNPYEQMVFLSFSLDRLFAPGPL